MASSTPESMTVSPSASFMPLFPQQDTSMFHMQQSDDSKPRDGQLNEAVVDLRPSFAHKHFHVHHDSISTSTSESNDSSPTTTASTVDDSSATEPSPGSSPESPLAKPPSSQFGTGILRPRISEEENSGVSATAFFEMQRPGTPSKKARNLKNLAVNTNASKYSARAASTTSLPVSQPADNSSSDLASPAFVKPPTPAKKRPSALGLSIMTPANTNTPPQLVKLSVPPTPSFGRPGTLRHFQSSPSLPLFPSRCGKQPSLAVRSKPTLDTIMSPIQATAAEPVREEEQNFDVPQSKEEKPEAYPNGPITVYDPFIDLYLEPTAEQASEYDVIMNVASEVRNPFLSNTEPLPTADPEIRLDGGGGIQYAPKREYLSTRHETGKDLTQDNSPTTPKATPLAELFSPITQPVLSSKREPEYIHIPWEHNSDIVPDLLRLVKLVDDRVSEGKRVLVHCQCGVSRSASLVVAYGLYKDPSMSVQEAYDVVKKASKWIGPNMSLIMQLQEFRSSLARGGLILGDSRTPITPSTGFNEWHRQASGGLLATPRTAPLVPPDTASSTKTSSSEPIGGVSPGPSSAPSGLGWPTDEQASTPNGDSVKTVKTESAYVDPSGHLVPVVKVVRADSLHTLPPQPTKTRPPSLNLGGQPLQFEPTETSASLSSPGSAEFSMTPLHPPTEVENTDPFGIMSPTATEFSSSPFDRAALLSSLGMGSTFREHEPELQTTQPRPPALLQSQHSSDDSHTLQKKLSSPSIKEQQQLYSLQAELEAQLPHHSTNDSGVETDALMSPRATEFTQNPFALVLSVPAEEAGRRSTEVEHDPRSPAQKGASPITRNILDYL